MRLTWVLDRVLRAAAVLTASASGLFIFIAGLFAVIARDPLLALAGFGIWAVGGTLCFLIIIACFKSPGLRFSSEPPKDRKAIWVTWIVYSTGFTGLVLAVWKSAELLK